MANDGQNSTREGWAKPVRTLDASAVEPGGPGINVSGRRPTSPIQGFGRMWQKTYRIALTGCSATPREVIGRVEAELRQLLAQGQPLLRAAGGHLAG